MMWWLQTDMLRAKVEVYSIIATVVSFAQVTAM